MHNGSFSLSGTTAFYDSGGSGGNYSNNENSTFVVSPSITGEKVSFYLSSYSIQNGGDFLYIYNGNSAASPLLATLTGTGTNLKYASTSTDGCLTFVFTSNGSTVSSGWSGNLSTTLVSGSSVCSTASKLCPSNTLTYITDPTSTVPSGNNYGCMTTQQSPSWFYIKMASAGSATITMTMSADLDFGLWGPYASVAAAAAACGSYPAPVDCDYTTGTVVVVDVPNSTTGQVYVLMVSNFAGGFQTFTLAQTGGTGTIECTGLPGFCGINSVTASNLSVCNDNGTPNNTSDDYYTADIMVDFVNKPASGTLDLGGSVVGSYSVAVGSATSPYTFTSVHIPANGSATSVSATFSASMTCTGSVNLAAVNSCGPAIYPGNVSAGLLLWLKADAGTSSTTNGAAVSTWADQSGSNHNATTTNNASWTSAGVNPPTFATGSTSSAFNYNPTLNFSGAKTLDGAAGLSTKQVFAVVRDGSANSFILGYDDPDGGGGGAQSGLYNTATMLSHIARNTSGNNLLTISQTHALAASIPKIIDAQHVSAAAGSILLNGGGSSSATATGTAPAPFSGAYRLNKTSDNQYPFNGLIAEVISYNGNLTTTERNRIDSYLAIKYGITKTGNYLASDGTTTTWMSGDGYDNDIAGIGRDDASCLYQKQSASASATNLIAGNNLLSIANNNFATTNQANSASLAADKTFLIWGNNGAANTFSTAVAGAANTNHLLKIWKATQTDNAATVRFRVPQSLFTAGATPYLYLSTDATFTNADQQVALSPVGSFYEASVDLSSRANSSFYFTFAQFLIQPVSLTLTSTASAATVVSGNALNFVLTLSNTSANTAINIKVKDQLPAGLTIGSATPSVGTYDSATRIWTVPTLGPSPATATLTINTTVQ